MKSFNIIDCPNNQEVIVRKKVADKMKKTFAFDQVFGPNSRQMNVYLSTVHPIISEVLVTTALSLLMAKPEVARLL